MGMMGQTSDELEESSLGSGIILSSDGYILTNYHVIEGADQLKVNAGGEEYTAQVVGTDESSDLAVLKIGRRANLDGSKTRCVDLQHR